MLELCNVSKSYKNEEVLKKVNLKFPSKGLFCILGKSGSGKSTFLKLLLGLLSPNKGTITIDNITDEIISKMSSLKNVLSVNKENENLCVTYKKGEENLNGLINQNLKN